MNEPKAITCPFCGRVADQDSAFVWLTCSDGSFCVQWACCGKPIEGGYEEGGRV